MRGRGSHPSDRGGGGDRDGGGGGGGGRRLPPGIRRGRNALRGHGSQGRGKPLAQRFLNRRPGISQDVARAATLNTVYANQYVARTNNKASWATAPVTIREANQWILTAMAVYGGYTFLKKLLAYISPILDQWIPGRITIPFVDLSFGVPTTKAILEMIPGAKKQIEEQVNQQVTHLIRPVLPLDQQRVGIPEVGLPLDSVLDHCHMIVQRDMDQDCAFNSTVPASGEIDIEHGIIIVQQLFNKTHFNPLEYPSLRYMENSVISSLCKIVHLGQKHDPDLVDFFGDTLQKMNSLITDPPPLPTDPTMIASQQDTSTAIAPRSGPGDPPGSGPEADLGLTKVEGQDSKKTDSNANDQENPTTPGDLTLTDRIVSFLPTAGLKTLLDKENFFARQNLMEERGLVQISDGCGSIMSSDNEAYLAILKVYRDRARMFHSTTTHPEIVVTSSTHPGWIQCAELMGIHVVVVPIKVTNGYQVDVTFYSSCINANTILLIASPCTPSHGLTDPIIELAAVARAKHVPLHIDACHGGFFLAMLGAIQRARPARFPTRVTIPQWDFSLNEVASMTLNLNRDGYCPKGGSSVVLYRTQSLRKYQFAAQHGWTGGMYLSPTPMGPVPGAGIAGTWAALQLYGSEGYLKLTERILDAKLTFVKSLLTQYPELELIGSPSGPTISFTTAKAFRGSFSVLTLADALELDQLVFRDNTVYCPHRPWVIQRQSNPDAITLTFTANDHIGYELTERQQEQFELMKKQSKNFELFRLGQKSLVKRHIDRTNTAIENKVIVAKPIVPAGPVQPVEGTVNAGKKTKSGKTDEKTTERDTKTTSKKTPHPNSDETTTTTTTTTTTSKTSQTNTSPETNTNSPETDPITTDTTNPTTNNSNPTTQPAVDEPDRNNTTATITSPNTSDDLTTHTNTRTNVIQTDSQRQQQTPESPRQPPKVDSKTPWHTLSLTKTEMFLLDLHYAVRFTREYYDDIKWKGSAALYGLIDKVSLVSTSFVSDFFIQFQAKLLTPDSIPMYNGPSRSPLSLAFDEHGQATIDHKNELRLEKIRLLSEMSQKMALEDTIAQATGVSIENPLKGSTSSTKKKYIRATDRAKLASGSEKLKAEAEKREQQQRNAVRNQEQAVRDSEERADAGLRERAEGIRPGLRPEQQPGQ